MPEKHITIREYQQGDELKILSLFEQVYGFKRSIDHWLWQFQNNVKGSGDIMLALAGDELVGHCALMRSNINFMGKEIKASQSCDTMIKSDYRGIGFFPRLSLSNNEKARLNGIQAVFNFPNHNSYPSYIRNIGRKKLTRMTYYYYRIGYKKVIRQVFDKVGKQIFSSSNYIKYYIKFFELDKKIFVSVQNSIPDNIHHILLTYNKHTVFSIWKDFEYLKWRYENHPVNKYLFHILFSENTPVGIAICKIENDIITICEFIHKTKNIKQSILLLRHIINYYYKTNAQNIIFIGWDDGFFNTVFSSCQFRAIPGSQFVLVGQVLDQAIDEISFYLNHNWSIMAGDIDII